MITTEFSVQDRRRKDLHELAALRMRGGDPGCCRHIVLTQEARENYCVSLTAHRDLSRRCGHSKQCRGISTLDVTGVTTKRSKARVRNLIEDSTLAGASRVPSSAGAQASSSSSLPSLLAERQGPEIGATKSRA